MSYVQITPSGIIPNLIQYGTSMIACGNQQDLHLDPGTYSVDPDENSFNASVSLNQNQDIPYSFFLLLNRIGNINIIVESMVYICFQIYKVHY